MSTQETIERKLAATLAPELLAVENESHNHSVPRGSETHFKVVVVARAFDGLSRVDRHRLVHSALGDLAALGIHALAVTSRTPAEWATPEGSVPLTSPPCLGGSKADKILT